MNRHSLDHILLPPFSLTACFRPPIDTPRFPTNTATTFNTTALALRASLMLRLAGGAGLLLLLLQLLHALLVGSGLLARVLAGQLHGALVRTLVAETQVGHQTLDLGRLVALVAAGGCGWHAWDPGGGASRRPRRSDPESPARPSSRSSGSGRRYPNPRCSHARTCAYAHPRREMKIPNQRRDEHGSRTCRRQAEDAHGSCRELPASWGNPAYRFLQ